MSASSDVFPERKHLSNVNISPISSEVLYVRIRKMSGEEDTPQTSSSFRQISRKPEFDQSKNGNHSKSIMTESGKTASVSSQTLQKEQKASLPETHSAPDSSPCLKHAAENISRKACNIPSEKISLCNNCSKSMLCYIFLVQDFLDSLAKEINGGESSSCLQCARQEMRNSIAQSDFRDELNVESTVRRHSDYKANVDSTPRKHADHKSSANRQKDISRERRSGDRMFKGKSQSQVSQRKEDVQGIENVTRHSDENKQKQHRTDFSYSVSPPNMDNMGTQNVAHASDERRVITDQLSSENKTIQQTSETGDNHNQQWTTGNNYVSHPAGDNQAGWSAPIERESDKNGHTAQSSGYDNTQFSPYQQTNGRSGDTPEFRTLKERVQPNYQPGPSTIPENPHQNDPNNNMFENSPSLFRENLDGIISTLSTAEREIYDSARDTAGWESLTETQRLVVPSGNLITSEAFVTSCRNNAEAIGCLVLGTSLLLCRTSRTLCVLVSEGVSTAFK